MAAERARAVEQQALAAEKAGNNNRRNGYAVYRWDDGDVFAGSFDASEKKGGPGVMRFANVLAGKHQFNVGDMYQGEYANDSRTGYGVHTRSDGSVVHAGLWSDGVPVSGKCVSKTLL